MPRQQHLLTDAAMREFIIRGYVTVKTDFPADFHATIRRCMEDVIEHEGNPGNNILPRIPEIKEVFDHPAVHGALTSILGPNYYMHPHRYCHINTPGSQGQRQHIDSWSKRHHRTRWAMAFYYPQDTTADMGPTGVNPGSQYYNNGPGTTDEIPLTGDAGTVTVVHYDLWHRATPNQSDKKRFMAKFLFTRLEEPDTPTWDATEPAWPACDAPEQGIWHSVWNWHTGQPYTSYCTPYDDDVSRLIRALRGPMESESLRAAYALGATGDRALSPLIETLKDEDGAVRRNAGYALTAMGIPAVGALTDLARDTSMPDYTRETALDTLGDIGKPAGGCVPTLIDVLSDDSILVRRAAADALGTMDGAAKSAIPAMINSMSDEDEWVRRNTVLSCLRMGRDAEEAAPSLISALRDENRYIRAKAAKALERIGTPDALKALLQFYESARWCPISTREQPY